MRNDVDEDFVGVTPYKCTSESLSIGTLGRHYKYSSAPHYLMFQTLFVLLMLLLLLLHNLAGEVNLVTRRHGHIFRVTKFNLVTEVTPVTRITPGT